MNLLRFLVDIVALEGSGSKVEMGTPRVLLYKL
jgi:hypothetical protein